MAKRKKAVGIVDKGAQQPQQGGNPGAVMTARFKKGSDKSKPRHKLNVSAYEPRYKSAISTIDRILKKRG